MEENLILVVDDEAETTGMLNIYLSKKGYVVITAANGQDALTLVREHNPILVVTDYRMPKMDGVELLIAIKKLDRNIQVILISGHADMKVAVEALKHDAFDFLEKPLQLNELTTCIKNVIKRTKSMSKSKAYVKTGGISHEIFPMKKLISGIYINIPLDEFIVNKLKSEIKSFKIENILQPNIIFVFNNVDYINNVGLNLLIDMHKELIAEGYKLIFSQLSDPVYNYMKTLGYLDYFEIQQNLDDAIAELS